MNDTIYVVAQHTSLFVGQNGMRMRKIMDHLIAFDLTSNRKVFDRKKDITS